MPSSGLPAPRWISFDCYGTLIDWQSGVRKAFRELEDTDLTNEITIDGDPDVATVGHWARIDDTDFIISTLGSPSDTVVDVVLYDPDDPTLTPINLTSDHAGKYALGWIGFDPAAPQGGR